MPNNPYDDLLKNLVKLLEQITSLEQNMKKVQDGPSMKPGIIGCAIITGSLPHQGSQNQDPDGKTGLSYEMVDAGKTAYLTVQLPAHLSEDPLVEFSERSCHISTQGLSGNIELQFPIVPQTSTWTFCNGILDVVLEKVPSELPGVDPEYISEAEFS